MVIDKELLERAQAAGTAMAEAERQATVARGDYHTAIRRMHLGGASLREIAAALGLSHQRVQQIVDKSGGSWWQKLWRTRTVKPGAICTFCQRPPSELAKLLAGPEVYICDDCVGRAEGPAAPFEQAARGRCSFCSQRGTVARSPRGSICSACLKVSREILEQR